MQFAICNEIFQGWTFPDTLAYARRAGYDAVEVAPFTVADRVTSVSPSQRAGLRAEAGKAGIEISGIHWVLAHTEGFHLSHPDSEVRERTAGYLVDLVDFCADLGGRSMIVGSPRQRSLLPGVTRAEAWDRATEVFRPAVAQASRRGVTVCIEPLAPAETDFINTFAEAARFAAQFGSASMSVILDVKAMSSEAQSVPDVIRSAVGQFSYFHANDPNLKGPGFGDLDYRPVVAALREVGYDGVVSVEVFRFDEGPEAIATRSRDYLRRVFGG